MLDKSQLNFLPQNHLPQNNTSAAEVARFNQLAQEWWNPKGKFKRVLDFNACRFEIIAQQLQRHFSKTSDFSGLTALDIGCGGGLLCEPLAKMGMSVTGIDASEMSVKVAQRHAVQSGLKINYRHCLSSDLVDQPQRYDVVMNTEVIEHVPDQQQLIAECCELLKPGGLLILATLNRTPKSYLFGIVGAEYVLRLLPVGTHDWKAFVKPKELQSMMQKNACEVTGQSGIAFNPFTGVWSASNSVQVNYMMFATKPN